MSEVETATVVWHEPALFDAPPTHMRVPLAVRAAEELINRAFGPNPTIPKGER